LERGGIADPDIISARQRGNIPNGRRSTSHIAIGFGCWKLSNAHVRTGTDGGTGIKPGDRYAVPLCAACHAEQHRVGELAFWSTLRIDPVNVALRLWTISADVEAGERTVFRARQSIDLAQGFG
jgi:hypothetical protein